jgi:pimeloyl-ACP methyl ester carboxylesterase
MRRSAAAVLLVAALAACTSSTGGAKAVTTMGPMTTSGGAPSPTATAPNTTVNWKPCPEVARQELGQTVPGWSFECGGIDVPQDWNHPANGKTYHIALIRARSDAQTNRIGSLVVNPGGPGGSGVGLAIDLTQSLPKAVTSRFDIVGFDPRGVGHSTQVQCLTAADEDSLYGAEPDPKTQADFDAIVALTKRAVSACGTKYGDQLALFSTEQAARDIDSVRQAVGDDKLTYLGYSYGTLLGAVYAQLFPTHIRAMVLDGAIDPKQNLIQRSEGQAAGFEHAFDDFSAWCKLNPTQCPISADPRAAVVAALDKARTSPVKGPDGRDATAGWIFTALGEAMYTQQFWAPLARGIDNLRNGDARLIFALADSYAERDSSGHYTNLADANDAVNCADASTRPSVAEIRQLQDQWRTKYPLFGGPFAVGMLVCAAGEWPGGQDPYPTGKAAGAPPIVVVGTKGDPATPFGQTAKLADMLGVGHVIAWDGEGHTAYPQTKCITDAVNAYLVDLTVPATGLDCPKR